MTESMVERVARALTAVHYAARFNKPVDDAHVQANVDANWRIRYHDARAAIAAMREPTPHMIDGVIDWDRAVWRTMLSRALADHQSPPGAE